MKQHRRLLSSVVLIVTAPLLLTGCGQSSGGDGGEIVFRSFDPPSEISGLEQAVEKWNENHEVKARIETVAVADALAQYTREVNGKSGPDVSQTAFTWVRDLAEAGLVMNLDEQIADNPPGDGLDDFLGLDINQLDGSTYGIPWTVDTYALAYSPDVLAEAGVDELPADWEDFAGLAADLTTPDRAGFCFAASSAPTSDVWHLLNYYMWSNGTPLIEESDGEFTVGATDSEIAAAFSYLNDFFVSGTSPANMISIDNSGDPAINSALADGSCAIAFMAPANFKVALASNDALVTGSVPTGSEGEPTTHLGGRSLTVNPNTQNPEAAWEFVKFMSSQEVFEEDYTGQFPAQVSLVEAIDFGDHLAGYQAELPTARTYSVYIDSPSATSEYWGLTAQTTGSVFSGQMDPNQASVSYREALEGLAGE
ncbi:ABC transporter substrate-binding protein [Glaciibacter superstes]|uniref:ABC transporter substrate-binding protein n=1 Tax=Glaciibacter superstes TaxID=501023 RepID=UPI0003B5927A|nr:sugar ABC transporter substrate-binding protein [Glaciibacter superstes]